MSLPADTHLPPLFQPWQCFSQYPGKAAVHACCVGEEAHQIPGLPASSRSLTGIPWQWVVQGQTQELLSQATARIKDTQRLQETSMFTRLGDTFATSCNTLKKL